MHKAIEVFAKGFSYTRSFTHPYLAEQMEKIWAMRDAERANGDYRTEEWTAWAIDPEDVHRVATKQARGRYAICAVHTTAESDQPLRDGYKALNYRLGATEPIMVHPLKRVPRVSSPARITRVKTMALAEQVNQAAGARQVLPEHLGTDTPLRQYAARIDGEVVGWVRSIDVGSATWCSNLFVHKKSRRLGIGRALMARMLRDDRAFGSRLAVLTASHTGALLYPTIGYEQIGSLMLFTPKKR